ncbi:hypothetical protein GGI12_002115 [Dipsacomyces acuminosporus]|nr:hypothetical protein GGI12_002115 [Dipsacomyces acuminosporus]
MWGQITLVVGAFALGYYFATHASVPKGKEPSEETKDGMAGAFPEQHGAGNDSHAEASKPGKHGSKKKKKKSKQRHKQSKEEESTQEPAMLPNTASKKDTGRNSAGKSEALIRSPDQPKELDNSEPGDDADADSDTDAVADADADVSEIDKQTIGVWETVGEVGARPQKKAANPIPVHGSVWNDLESDEDLSKEPEPAAASARVLRIGAAQRPPPQPQRRSVRPQAANEPLTKKQRQNMRKQQKEREARVYAAQVQEERLRQHQRELVDVRSHEQWAKAKRHAAKKGSSAGPSSSKVNGTASVFNGKLIWDS